MESPKKFWEKNKNSVGIADGLAGLFGGEGGVATKAKGQIKTPTADEVDFVSVSRSASDVMKVVRQRTPGLRHIYNKFLKKKPGFQGKVALKFMIAPGGEIISISIAYSTTNYGDFDDEIKSAVSRWKFNKIKSGVYMSDESPNNILLDENEIKALLDYYIDQYDQYKLDSKWLLELKSAIYPENEASKPFDIVITRSTPQMRNVGAAFIPQTGNGLAGKPQIVFYSPPKNSDFNSTAALAKLIHELAHAYQYYVLNEPFPNKDKNPKIEIFPYSKQFELEKKWNISNNPLIRNYFEEIDKTSEDEAERIYRKTKGLYERLGYNRE